MNKFHKISVGIIISFLSIQSASAEPYVGLSLGWAFNQKLSSITGNENVNYPSPYDNSNPDTTLYKGTNYSDLNLKDTLTGGVKAGYYFDSAPNWGLELEFNYSKPNMLRQNVTLTNPNFQNVTWLGQTSATEDQLPASVKLFQFNLNALYRYQELGNFIPYIGAGPSLNIMRITGTGYSGIFVDPAYGDTNSCAGNSCPNVSQTSVNLGINFKLGAEYKFDKDWGVAGEYHYNWSPVDIDNFRSASNLKSDYEAHSLSVVLMRHF